MDISVIFPAYNEEQNITGTMCRSLEALRSQFGRFEIIIVDDASVDETGKIADALATKYPEVKVLHNATNRGQGASILIGFRHARYDLVIHNAMDYPFDLKDLSKMLSLLDDADIVVAVPASRKDNSLYRKFVSIVNIALLHFLFDLRLRDYNFVQLYKKPVLDAIEIDAESTGFVTPEMLIRAHNMGYRIKEIEIDCNPRERGVATSGRLRVIVSSLRDMLRFWLKRTKVKKATRRASSQNSLSK